MCENPLDGMQPLFCGYAAVYHVFCISTVEVCENPLEGMQPLHCAAAMLLTLSISCIARLCHIRHGFLKFSLKLLNLERQIWGNVM